MDAGSVFLILALFILVGLFVGRPFFLPRVEEASKLPSAPIDSMEHQRSSLLAERDRLLTALQELDFDHRLGKIPEEDYPSQRAELLQRAAGVLRGLDEIEGKTAQPNAEDRVERAVAARRADARTAQAGAAAPSAPDDLESLISARRSQRQEKTAGFCPRCGKPVQKSDLFCSRCGTTL